jgi:LAO/AO transport system kinase
MAADMSSAAAARRALGRALSRAADADVAQALALTEVPFLAGAEAWRIGITGAPGAGKSSLIGRLARLRLDRLSRETPPAGAPPERLAVIAIDPSSPVSHGSILGDRIRMEDLAGDRRAYIRSLPSRGGRDGLTHNIVDILTTLDAYGFAETILETVGVGQAEHAVRLMVDTVVLVLHPESGDFIQAMKAGVMELADVYVVNKADLPGARRAAAELRATLRGASADGFELPILAVSQNDPHSLSALDEALEAHRAHVEINDLREARLASRRAYHLESLVLRRMAELRDAAGAEMSLTSVAASYRRLLARLAEEADQPGP